MARTTVDIDDPVLMAVKRLSRDDGKSLGATVSELLLEALDGRERHGERSEPLAWVSKPMGARVDLADKEAVYELLDDRNTRLLEVAEPTVPYGEPEP